MYNELVEDWKDSHPCSMNTQRIGTHKIKSNKWKYKTVFVSKVFGLAISSNLHKLISLLLE